MSASAIGQRACDKGEMLLSQVQKALASSPCGISRLSAHRKTCFEQHPWQLIHKAEIMPTNHSSSTRAGRSSNIPLVGASLCVESTVMLPRLKHRVQGIEQYPVKATIQMQVPPPNKTATTALVAPGHRWRPTRMCTSHTETKPNSSAPSMESFTFAISRLRPTIGNRQGSSRMEHHRLKGRSQASSATRVIELRNWVD